MRVNVRRARTIRWKKSDAQRREELETPALPIENRAENISILDEDTVRDAPLISDEKESNTEQEWTKNYHNHSLVSSITTANEGKSNSICAGKKMTVSAEFGPDSITVEPTETEKTKYRSATKLEIDSTMAATALGNGIGLRNTGHGDGVEERLIHKHDDSLIKEADDSIVTDEDESWQKIMWQLMPETPVGRALVSATQMLVSSGIDTASLDAQVILAHILGKDRAWLFAHHEYLLSEDEAEAFTEFTARRMDYEPVAYLIGRKEFYGLDFTVDHRVLIPRPETELLVDSVLDHLEMWADEMPIGYQLCVADVGTGCGAIALSVAANAPDVRVYATDISPGALEIARTNIHRLDKRCQVSLMQGDLLEPLRNKVDMPKVDMIVANLPYINSTDYAGLAPDVLHFEPQLALEAGPQGLDSIARLLEQATDFLNPGGVILLEIGYDQGEAVTGLAEQLIPDARSIKLRQDYNGRDRLVTIAL